MMNTLNQWLEGKKKKGIEDFDKDPLHPLRAYKVGYNTALTDTQKALPTLLSTMEAEIRERIGEVEPHLAHLATYKERSRVHTIIKDYFKTQV